MLGGKKREEKMEVKSILAEGLEIEGNVHAEGKIRIDGTIVGDITGDFIIFGPTASVKGNVKTGTVIVMGTIDGNLNVERAEIKSSSRIRGDITAKELLVEVGASIEGQVKSGSYSEAPSPIEIEE